MMGKANRSASTLHSYIQNGCQREIPTRAVVGRYSQRETTHDPESFVQEKQHTLTCIVTVKNGGLFLLIITLAHSLTKPDMTFIIHEQRQMRTK